MVREWERLVLKEKRLWPVQGQSSGNLLLVLLLWFWWFLRR